MDVWVGEERVRLARLQAVRRRRRARDLKRDLNNSVNIDLCEDQKKKSNLSCFALGFLDEVVDETIVEISSTKMGIASSGLYFENALVNSEERYIASFSFKIDDDDVTFDRNFLSRL